MGTVSSLVLIRVRSPLASRFSRCPSHTRLCCDSRSSLAVLVFLVSNFFAVSTPAIIANLTLPDGFETRRGRLHDRLRLPRQVKMFWVQQDKTYPSSERDSPTVGLTTKTRFCQVLHYSPQNTRFGDKMRPRILSVSIAQAHARLQAPRGVRSGQLWPLTFLVSATYYLFSS